MAVEKRDKLREELKAKRQKDLTKEKTIKKIVIAAIVFVVIALISLVAFGFYSSSKNVKNVDTLSKGEQLVPQNITENGAYFIDSEGKVAKESSANKSEKAKRVDVFFDPACPGCGIVDRALGDQWKQEAIDGKIALYMTPVAFLDKMSSDQYSTRSVNSLIVVAENEPEYFMDFVNALYTEENQPHEGMQYVPVTDEDLAATAESVGVSKETTKLFKEHSYVDWITDHTKTQTSRKDLFSDGFKTPSVFVGVEYKDGNATNFTPVVFDNNDVVGTYNKVLNEK